MSTFPWNIQRKISFVDLYKNICLLLGKNLIRNFCSFKKFWPLRPTCTSSADKTGWSRYKLPDRGDLEGSSKPNCFENVLAFPRSIIIWRLYKLTLLKPSPFYSASERKYFRLCVNNFCLSVLAGGPEKIFAGIQARYLRTCTLFSTNIFSKMCSDSTL